MDIRPSLDARRRKRKRSRNSLIMLGVPCLAIVAPRGATNVDCAPRHVELYGFCVLCGCACCGMRGYNRINPFWKIGVLFESVCSSEILSFLQSRELYLVVYFCNVCSIRVTAQTQTWPACSAGELGLADGVADSHHGFCCCGHRSCGRARSANRSRAIQDLMVSTAARPFSDGRQYHVHAALFAQ